MVLNNRNGISSHSEKSTRILNRDLVFPHAGPAFFLVRNTLVSLSVIINCRLRAVSLLVENPPRERDMRGAKPPVARLVSLRSCYSRLAASPLAHHVFSADFRPKESWSIPVSEDYSKYSF